MVVVTGDGIPVNSVYRDGDLEWPVQALPVPLVLFCHGDPVGWDEPGATPPPGYELRPPTGTDDVLHFAEMVRHIAEGCYPPADVLPSVAHADGLLARADDLAARLHARCPPFFDAAGNRLGGTGETIVALWPHGEDGNSAPRATLEVWRRTEDRRWERVRAVEVDQRRTRATAPAPRPRSHAATPPAGGRRG
jgi:hypothetical protein